MFRYFILRAEQQLFCYLEDYRMPSAAPCLSGCRQRHGASGEGQSGERSDWE